MSTRKAIWMTAAALASFCAAWIAIKTYQFVWRPTQEDDIREAIVRYEVDPPFARPNTLFCFNPGYTYAPPDIRKLETRLASHPRMMKPNQRLQEGEHGIAITIDKLHWRRNDEVWVQGSCWPIGLLYSCGNGKQRTWIAQRQPNGKWTASLHSNTLPLLQSQTPWFDRLRLYCQTLSNNLGL